MRSSSAFPPVQEQPESLLGVSAPPIPIMVTPASPMAHTPAFSQEQLGIDRSAPSHAHESHTSEKTRLSIDTTRNKGKKVREVFISGVHKGRARVTTISKKIGHNVQHVGRHNSMRLKRSNSAPGTASFVAIHLMLEFDRRCPHRLPRPAQRSYAVPGILDPLASAPEHLRHFADRPRRIGSAPSAALSPATRTHYNDSAPEGEGSKGSEVAEQPLADVLRYLPETGQNRAGERRHPRGGGTR